MGKPGAMFNLNRKQTIESGAFACSKGPIATFDQKNLQKLDSSKLQSPTKEQKIKIDPIQIAITASIMIFLSIAFYVILGPVSMLTMAMGGALSGYHFFISRSKPFSKDRRKKQRPSIFLLVLIASPFVMGGVVALEGISLLESPTRIILLWSMTISFWTTMLFVPMSVMSKHRENLQPELKDYPKVSVIIPAYNEEKVIKGTLESMVEAHYPGQKEIIFVDDGSRDKTLEVAKKFKGDIVVLHKENGGKASALNYGLVYAKGEIIVVVDADTIIGRNSLTAIVSGFAIDEHVAGVAGNIRVRNRVNWITKCQALEYLVGIQVVRRALDLFGAIAVIPGALGAFKKSALSDVGQYGKNTLVEDFDQTIKLLKTGLTTQGSVKAVAYTEAPSTIGDFVKQRKRWYRGNIQVIRRHSDAMTNARFGNLQKIAFPFLFTGMIVTPIVGFIALIHAVIGIVYGDAIWVIQAAVIFAVVNFLMCALAIRIDDEDPKLLLYTGFLLFGYKQIVDFLLFKAILEQVTGRKATWTSAKRVGN